ncbi:hypothetical protein FRC17_003760 [Serendipita sp. 399]|nr:hypothetical protein FRC17_003760 [Serendipita sp. 399]
MDSLLVFVGVQAGLFSAVTAGLVVESYKDLREEPPFRTEQLLESILGRLNQPTSSSIGIPARVPFRPSVKAIAANALFFLSLTVSLLAALGAILVKQWTRRVYVGLNAITSSRRRARAHYLRMQGIKDWRLSEIIATVPMLLHVSLFLFLAGLVVWLSALQTFVFILILSTTALGLAIYLMAAMIPSFWPDAPFHWPVSSSFEALYNIFHNRRQKQSIDFLPLHDKNTTTTTANTNLCATDKILVTHLVQNTSVHYDSPEAGFDGLDLKILFELSKHTESPTQTDAIIDQFRRGMAHEYRTGHISESLDEQSVTAIVQKAAECAISCRMNQNDIRPGIFLERATTMMQFFEVALQVLDFASDVRKESLVAIAEMANLLMDRALFVGSVDEIALSAFVIARAQVKLDRSSHLERAERVFVALRELGPHPRNPESLPEDELEWTQERVEQYQRSISGYILSLTYLVIQFYTPSSSRVGGGAHQAQESSIQTLANEVSATLRAGRFPEKMGRSGASYLPLRDAMSVLWINLLGCSPKVTRWMERVMPPVGWIPRQAADGTHILEDLGCSMQAPFRRGTVLLFFGRSADDLRTFIHAWRKPSYIAYVRA